MRAVLPSCGIGLLVLLAGCSGTDEGGDRRGAAGETAPSAEVARLGTEEDATTAATAPGSRLLAMSRQHLVVVVEEPGSTTGRLHRYLDVDGEWQRVGDGIPIVVGRSGVGPKQEGDGRSPQGIFPLGFAFGYEETPPLATDLTYRHLPPESVCVDDSESSRYNHIVFEPGPDPDWNSAEAMRRDLAHGDDLYALGVTVEYNPDATPGAGSCIFLHIWRSPESPTAGCTAMAEGDLRTVLGWLQPRFEPILVQGSRPYLEELRARGRLPYPVPGA